MKEKLLPLSILALATALVVSAAVWGVITDREGQRRDQPPWPQYERRIRVPATADATKPRDCTRPPKRKDPTCGPGGVFDTGGYKYDNSDVEEAFDAIIYRGCPSPSPAP